MIIGPEPDKTRSRSIGFPKIRIDLPRPGDPPLDWDPVFGRTGARRVIDLGCGNGQYLLRSAAVRPEGDHLGIDIVPPSIHHAVSRAVASRLANVRFAVGDAYAFVVGGGLAPASVDEIHVYHPQPYLDPAQRRMRLITPDLVGAVFRALRRPDGIFVLQTDNPAYWRHIEQTVPVLFRWERRALPWPDAPRGRTRREAVAIDRGYTVYRGSGRPRPELAPAEVDAILARLPEPEFDAAPPGRAGRKAARRRRPQAGREH
jgi:tRNA (guanine-N7-)-methyltransferase